jgi:hypothetical protein
MFVLIAPQLLMKRDLSHGRACSGLSSRAAWPLCSKTQAESVADTTEIAMPSDPRHSSALRTSS